MPISAHGLNTFFYQYHTLSFNFLTVKSQKVINETFYSGRITYKPIPDTDKDLRKSNDLIGRTIWRGLVWHESANQSKSLLGYLVCLISLFLFLGASVSPPYMTPVAHSIPLSYKLNELPFKTLFVKPLDGDSTMHGQMLKTFR